MGQETGREWWRPGPSPLHAKNTTRVETKHQKMTEDKESHWEGERRGKKGDKVTNNIRPPRDQQETGHRLRESKERERTWYTATESGMQRRAQRR